MVNERQLGSNPYLRARGESQLRAKHTFERRCGWIYGFATGAFIIFFGYALDAWQLASIHAEYWWVKLVLAALTILPLALVAGGISGYVNWLLKMAVWAAFGVGLAYFAIHIPFDGVRFVLQPFVPDLKLVEYLPIPAAASGSFGMLATLGALLGLLVGLMQTVVVSWVWDRSTEDNKLTVPGLALFLLVVPFAFAYAFLIDGTAHTPLRAPVQLINSVVQSGLTDAPNQDAKTLELHRALVYMEGQKWREKMTDTYTLRLAASEPSQVGEAYVDATFSNGFNLRCRVTTYGEYMGGCIDLNAEYTRYLSEFVPRGSFRCADCEMRVESPAANWRAANGRALTASDKITVRHGIASTVFVRDAGANGSSFECLFSGANPVVVESCTTN